MVYDGYSPPCPLYCPLFYQYICHSSPSLALDADAVARMRGLMQATRRLTAVHDALVRGDNRALVDQLLPTLDGAKIRNIILFIYIHIYIFRSSRYFTV